MFDAFIELALFRGWKEEQTLTLFVCVYVRMDGWMNVYMHARVYTCMWREIKYPGSVREGGREGRRDAERDGHRGGGHRRVPLWD